MNSGKLYIVATPIGNLDDITLRALGTLKQVDLILCEDTRVTKNLLNHYQINKPLISYHQHSDTKKVNEIKKLLIEGKNLALVTDAGTPGISDPGNILIEAIVKSVILNTFASHSVNSVKDRLNHSEGILHSAQNDNIDRIIPIPGACAVIAALSISGFPTDKFIFMGFPPHKNKRQKFFKEVAENKYTTVFYESNHRIKKCLDELSRVLEPDKQAVICRELTKKFESVYRGEIKKILTMDIPAKGEFIIIINGKQFV